MNWYKIFYWISVADNVKFVMGTLSIILGIYVAIASVCAMGLFDYPFKEWEKGARKIFYIFSIAFFISIFCWVFMPSKKDALVIVAGGAVGEFLMSDSSAKQIPAEVTYLLKEKIKAEIAEIKQASVVDTLKEKSKEQLIDIIRNTN